jgi:hypothetical protein
MSYIYGAAANASKWQMGFNAAFKGLRQEQNSSTHLSTQIPLHSTLSYTSYVTCISQRVTKKSTRMTTVMTDWKVREVFDTPNVTYSKFYNPSEHLAVDLVIVLFKGKVALK